jgi:hypothetical protein
MIMSSTLPPIVSNESATPSSIKCGMETVQPQQRLRSLSLTTSTTTTIVHDAAVSPPHKPTTGGGGGGGRHSSAVQPSSSSNMQAATYVPTTEQEIFCESAHTLPRFMLYV